MRKNPAYPHRPRKKRSAAYSNIPIYPHHAPGAFSRHDFTTSLALIGLSATTHSINVICRAPPKEHTCVVHLMACNQILGPPAATFQLQPSVESVTQESDTAREELAKAEPEAPSSSSSGLQHLGADPPHHCGAEVPKSLSGLLLPIQAEPSNLLDLERRKHTLTELETSDDNLRGCLQHGIRTAKYADSRSTREMQTCPCPVPFVVQAIRHNLVTEGSVAQVRPFDLLCFWQPTSTRGTVGTNFPIRHPLRGPS